MNEFVPINNSKSVATCTKHVNEHVQGASGTNQSNICDLSQQPSLNTVSTETLHIIKLHTNWTLQLNMIKCLLQTHNMNLFSLSLWIQKSHLNDRMKILILVLNFKKINFILKILVNSPRQTPTIPLEHFTTNLPPPQNHHEHNLEITSDDNYYIVEYERHLLLPPFICKQHK